MSKTIRMVLIGFEQSQVITKEFRRQGVEAFSNDLLFSYGGRPEWHIKEDFFEVIKRGWEFVIIHPPCTTTCTTGNRWYANTPERSAGVAFTLHAWEMARKFSKYAILEQPVSVISTYLGIPDQRLQPWQFGHYVKKETWLWLYNLPKLEPTKIVEGASHSIHRMKGDALQSRNRSKTFKGIAQAIVNQYKIYL